MNPPKAVLPILRKLRNSDHSDGRAVAVLSSGDAVAVDLTELAVTWAVRRGRVADARRPAARLGFLDFGMVLLRKSVSDCYPDNP
jgi:hypothetical protein